MALADVLRERASRRGRTAQADCGALGVLTVEALPPRECAALARGPDGDRAVFYAACRELQAAGEELRRAGQVFTPDGVMQYVSDREAAAAARTVLALSGVELAEDKPDVPEQEEQEDEAGSTGGSDSLTSAPREAAGADASVRVEETVPADGAVNEWPGQEAENRLETVQNLEKQFLEIRPGTVQKQPAETEVPFRTRREAEKEFREIRRETVQKPVPAELALMAEAGRNKRQPERSGQVSREFADNLDKNSEVWKPDKKTQSLVEKPEKKLQNVAEKTGRTKWETAPAPKRLLETEAGACEGAAEVLETQHEITSESGGGPETDLHETMSEFGGPEIKAHEIKSEVQGAVHEITSVFEQTDVSKLHESRTEIPEAVHESKSEYADGLHETASESGGGPRLGMHESKSEVQKAVHEITSESAERMARLLLEGLRRAYMVR